MAGLIDLGQRSFWISAASVIFNPTFWNIAARSEYNNHTLTRLANGNRLRACYALAITIFLLGIFRDYLYKTALTHQPTSRLLLSTPFQILAVVLVLSGNVLVLSSMYALGITGTYLGDYFGILMDEVVTGFPFNVSGAPMYWGSTMSFVGTAIWYGKPAGLLLSALVWSAYKVALRFEDPFTEGIYRKRDEERSKGKAEGRIGTGRDKAE